MPAPHGGRLINRVLEGSRREDYLRDLPRMPRLDISQDLARDCENIASGVFSPLTGFATSNDHSSILDHMRLPNDVPWTMPIILDIDPKTARSIRGEGQVALWADGRPVALTEVEEIYPFDRKMHAQKVYDTTDPAHPGVAKTLARNKTLVGGQIWLLNGLESAFPKYHLVPKETRVLFKEKGWRTVVGFQTRNVPHVGHEYLQKTALSFTDGLLINPVIGRKKAGDFKDEVIIETYDALIRHYYLRERAVLVTLQFEMRYAGPREAIFHAIVRKNYGCTHFIVGRDHAGVGSYYAPYAAQEIFDEFPDLGITPLFFTNFFHCKRCGGVANDKTCPHPESDRVSFSGTKIRDLITNRQRPPPEIMRPEIAGMVLGWEKPLVE